MRIFVQMKKNPLIAAWFLILVLLFNSIQTGVMLGYYMIDTGSFVEVFCVNKDTPELKCNGKCEMAKLTSQNDDADKPGKIDFLNKTVTLYLFEEMIFSLNELFSQNQKNNYFYSNHYFFLHKKILDHPPTVLS